jgi:DNA-binding HxlR family transcriptional regulator
MQSDQTQTTLGTRLHEALDEIATWQSTGSGKLTIAPRPSFWWRQASMQKLEKLGFVERIPGRKTATTPAWQITDVGWEYAKRRL